MSRLEQPLSALLQTRPGGAWWPLIQRWRDSALGQALIQAIDARWHAGAVIYPAEIFLAMELTPPESVKVVVLGQDPYHGPDQAEGLAFSVASGQAFPPSLRNVFKELQRDLGLPIPAPGSGSLRAWAASGVLLLNSSLTVEGGSPGSHSRLGWRALTDDICRTIWMQRQPTVFMLWGAHAQTSAAQWAAASPASGSRAGAAHCLLSSNHPSPLSALRPPSPFIGNGHFGAANAFLRAAGRAPVDWQLGPSRGMV